MADLAKIHLTTVTGVLGAGETMPSSHLIRSAGISGPAVQDRIDAQGIEAALAG